MKRVILDTNIYGRIIEFGDYDFVLENKDNVLAYGSVIVRKELRQTDADVKVEFMEQARNFRILLLSLYDLIVGERNLGVSQYVEKLAEQYFSAYKKFGGNALYQRIIEDFTIVATASLNRLEIVYSDDKGTMVSEEAVKAYGFVNDMHNLQTPVFRSYEYFKQELKKPLWRGDK